MNACRNHTAYNMLLFLHTSRARVGVLQHLDSNQRGDPVLEMKPKQLYPILHVDRLLLERQQKMALMLLTIKGPSKSVREDHHD